MNNKVTPYILKDAPALIEKILPVQKLSAEVYKERKAGTGQTLTPLGSYWKGRKPLILSKACILGSLLPATDDLARDLQIFEKLMAMDDESFAVRQRHRPKPKEILSKLSIACIEDYFTVIPVGVLPSSAPVDWLKPEYSEVKVVWRDDITELERLRLEVQLIPKTNYRRWVELSKRPEEVNDAVHTHIWEVVNTHLGTTAYSFTELVEQLGIMRFGHRPRIADTFCGSGQIPFEAARLGCKVYASDLNPIACMLTWGAYNIVGDSLESRKIMYHQQKNLVDKVLAEIDSMNIETDGNGWRAKSYLYCVEVRCPQSGWLVPLLPSRLISYGKQAIAELIPNVVNKRYDIVVRNGVSSEELMSASNGTLRSDGIGQDPYLTHVLNGIEFRTKISTIRGDYRTGDGETGSKLRLWKVNEFIPRKEDIFQERLYAVQWMRPIPKSKKFEYEFRSVSEDDLKREKLVEDFVGRNLAEWQKKGWIPDMKIEPGYNTDQPIRERGWTYWHHLFPSRHLLIIGLMRKYINDGKKLIMLCRTLNYTSKLCIWSTSKPGSSKLGGGGRTGGGSDNPVNVFYNQALNTLFNYGCRGSYPILQMFDKKIPSFTCAGDCVISCHPAKDISERNDIYITDPPYGDAVNYDEILEFFISWIRKNPPPEFANWIWDSRRSLAIKGEDEKFRQGMVAAYRCMTELYVRKRHPSNHVYTPIRHNMG